MGETTTGRAEGAGAAGDHETPCERNEVPVEPLRIRAEGVTTVA
jgi:hypothetical protein